MKKLLLLLFTICCVCQAYSQTTGYLRNDTVIITNATKTATLILETASKGHNWYLKDIGNGRLQFVQAEISDINHLQDSISKKANDNTVVHKSGDETINDIKTFDQTIIAPRFEANSHHYDGSSIDFPGGYIDGSGVNDIYYQGNNRGYLTSTTHGAHGAFYFGWAAFDGTTLYNRSYVPLRLDFAPGNPNDAMNKRSTDSLYVDRINNQTGLGGNKTWTGTGIWSDGSLNTTITPGGVQIKTAAGNIGIAGSNANLFSAMEPTIMRVWDRTTSPHAYYGGIGLNGLEFGDVNGGDGRQGIYSARALTPLSGIQSFYLPNKAAGNYTIATTADVDSVAASKSDSVGNVNYINKSKVTNGLTYTDSLRLGGDLTGDTYLAAHDKFFQIETDYNDGGVGSDGLGSMYYLDQRYSNLYSQNDTLSTHTRRSNILTTNENFDYADNDFIFFQNGGTKALMGSQYDNKFSFISIASDKTPGIIITDQISQMGAYYGGRYEHNFVDSSLVTKRYVDSVAKAKTDSVGGSLTFSTGLTKSSNTVTSNLSTGVSGGQSVIGGTALGDNLTLSSTTNASKGRILFGSSAYNETNDRLGIGITSPISTTEIYSGGNSSANGLIISQGNTGGNTNSGRLFFSNTAAYSSSFAIYSDGGVLRFNYGANPASTSGTTGFAMSNTGVLTVGNVISSLGTSHSFYNTSDQTTNYERLRQFWNSNVFSIQSEAGGTGTIRDVKLASGSRFINLSSQGNNLTTIELGSGNTAANNIIAVTSGTTLNGNSNSQNVFSLYPTVNKTGTLGYNLIYGSPYEQSVGSGTNYLINLGTNSAVNNGGTHTPKFTVDNTGKINSAALSASQIVATDASKNLVSVQLNVSNSTTTALSSSTLNSTYPSAVLGFRVICEAISAGPIIYTKDASGWLSMPATVVP